MPETIWAIHDETYGAIELGRWADTVRHMGGTEYRRADLPAPAPVRVKDLVWDDTFFVVHASGGFEFFMSYDAAHERADHLDRGFYCYDAEAVAKFGDRLRVEKEAWEAEEKAHHTACILAVLEPAPDALADPRVVALVEALRPFTACVFNDNGDVTISTGHLTTRDWLRLCEAAKGAGE